MKSKKIFWKDRPPQPGDLIGIWRHKGGGDYLVLSGDGLLEIKTNTKFTIPLDHYYLFSEAEVTEDLPYEQKVLE